LSERLTSLAASEDSLKEGNAMPVCEHDRIGPSSGEKKANYTGKFGGGASLYLILLCRKFPVSVKYIGKIACAARSFAGLFYGKTYPARLSTDSSKSRRSLEQGINRE